MEVTSVNSQTVTRQDLADERIGRNPKTGEEVPITSRRVLVFKPSQVLRERVDSALSPKS